MSHLSEVYAKDLGVKIGEPIFKPHFYPVLEEDYITIHNDNKVPAKSYDYWEEVIIIVKRISPDIKFLQIGSGKEPKIKTVDKFIPTPSIKQSAYIIKNSIMHVGIDSLPVHIASSLDKPIVAIYSHVYASTCGPIWNTKGNHTIIESNRGGNKPSFSAKESPKTINFIKPEEIANAILKELGEKKSNRETIHIGERYKENLYHIIPDEKYGFENKRIVIRFDLLHNEDNALHLFQKNQISILTKKPISENILSQGNIDNISYFSEEFDEEFVKKCKKFGVVLRLICTKEENLSDQRYEFFDEQVSLIEEDKKIQDNKEKVNLPEVDFEIKSYSLYMKNGQAHTSLYEANERHNLDDIFVDLDHLMIYSE